MPISPDSLPITTHVSSEVYDKIDEGLRRNADCMVHGFSRAILGQELSPGQQQTIRQRYLDAGWSRVEFLNSSENGERPGICQVKVFIDNEQSGDHNGCDV